MSSSSPQDYFPSSPPSWVEDLQRLVKDQQELLHDQQQHLASLEGQLKRSQERIEHLEAELTDLKKLKGKPKIRPSQLNTPKPTSESQGEDTSKRPGSDKASKKSALEIHESRIIQPDELPDGAKFNGYRNYDVQELKIERHNIRFRLAEYISSDGNNPHRSIAI